MLNEIILFTGVALVAFIDIGRNEGGYFYGALAL